MIGFTIAFSCVAGIAAGEAQIPVYEPELLDNGLKVIVHEDHELPVVYMELMIKTGSAVDPAGKEGLANFTAGTLTEGTESRNSVEIAEAIEFVGGSLSANAGYDATFLSCSVLKKNFDLGLDILAEVALHPAFPEEEVERQRSQIITEIIHNRDQKATIADINFQEVLFGDHPYSHAVIGTKESIGSITRADILEYYRTNYRPNASVIVVAGDVDRESVLESMRETFGGWKPVIVPETEQPEIPEPAGYRIRLVNKPDVTQSEIRIGYPGITRQDLRYFPLILMNYTLGAGNFSSRLMITIRSEKGLTYGIYSSLGARVLRGPFTISTFTRTESTLEAIEGIFEVIDKLKKEGSTAKELEDAKARYVGGFPLSIETPSQIAQQILRSELYGLGEDYLSRYTAAIERVDLEEVKSVASDFLRTQDMIIVVVGNADMLRDDLKKLGEVEEVFYIDLEGAEPPQHGH
jgi:zinc protease